MKKLLVTLLMAVGTVAMAHGPHNYGHKHYHPGYGWVAPALIGGAIVYGMTRPAPVPPPQVVVTPNYTPPPPGYRYEQLLDANCNCYRLVLVQVY
jgi:hypothetical protein